MPVFPAGFRTSELPGRLSPVQKNGQRDSGESWYRDGLQFECTRCGHCCSGATGTVRVSDSEIEALARRVSLSVEKFRTVYTRALRRGGISLREKRNRDCVFFDRDQGCTVYQQRPRQCRTWPFWGGVVATEDRWAEEAEDCPGMNRGKLHDATHIARTSRTDGTSGFVPITLDSELGGLPDTGAPPRQTGSFSTGAERSPADSRAGTTASPLGRDGQI